jgi:hypothetical protein
MKKTISRREALRWMALAITATLAACQNIIGPTPTASPVVHPTPSPTKLPVPTATSQPEIQPATQTPEGKNLATV